MTRSIDERVVEMRFDNQQFENGVNTTMKSIDRLKGGLNFNDAEKSLSSLERAGRAFSLGGIADGVRAISDRFSNLGIVGMTVLQNLTNSAFNAGKAFVKSLTIDPVKMGFDEYETKMNAIQTIMTNTAGKGTTMDDVTDTLNELNLYADQTIYNFAEMTRNIGTFTAAGIDLKTSAESIKGIANLAAGSGSNAIQASTAMYQLSQAMAAGAVKLQDWNSVVNAGMGGQLFQKALEKTAAELGKGRDMSVSFRESLEKGWITTEVLTKTLQKFAKDPSLLQAATQVKTFTQLIDTMKESVQSGWAQSWEAIIGNKDEAAGFLTQINNIFGEIVGSSANARNKMLEFWKANGGRYAMIESLFNTFKGIQEIIGPITKAFKSIFPPTTGKMLVEITEKIRDLTRTFKVSDETSNLLYRTFRGLFSIVDLGKHAFTAVASGISQVIKTIFPASKGFLTITANIGDFLVKLDHAIQRMGLFTGVVDIIVGAIKKVANGVKIAVSTVSKAISAFSKLDLGGIDAVSKHIQDSFKPFTDLGGFVGKAFSKVAQVIQTFAPIFYKIAETIGGAFSQMRDNIITSINDGTAGNIVSLINGGLFGSILIGLKGYLKSWTDIGELTSGFVSNIKGLLDGVRGSLAEYQSSIKAGTLLKIAVSVGILAVALMGLSKIDPKKLGVAMGSMTAMFVELFASMAIFQGLMGAAGFLAMMKITTSMIGLSVAVLLLTSAVTRLAKVDWEGLSRGLLGIAGLMLILVKSTKAMSTGAKSMIRASVGFVALGVALNILTTAVKRLGSMDTDKLLIGLVGVGAICAELVLFMKMANFGKMSGVKTAGFIALAAAVSILADAVKKFSGIDPSDLAKGLFGVGAVLTELALFVNLTGNAKKVASTAAGLILLGGAMLIFSQAIQSMGSMPIEQIAKGLFAMAGSLAIITTALKFMPKNIAGNAAGLVILSGALLLLSVSLSQMGKLSLDQIGRSLLALAGSLAIITVAMKFMKTALPGAAAMVVVAAALAILTPCLVALSSIPLAGIVVGLLALAGAFTVIGVAGLVLAPLIPTLIGLSASMALFGVACLAIGAGVLAFSTALATLSVSGAAGATALVAIITSIVGLIPFIFKTLAKGLVDFAKILADGAPTIAKAIMEILKGMLDIIIKMGPKIIETFSVLIVSLLDMLVKVAPKMVNAGMKLILGILKGIADHIADVVDVGIKVVLEFIKGIISQLPEIVGTAFKLIIGFINGLADAIRKNYKQLFDAVGNLISAIIEAIAYAMPKIVQIGVGIVKGLLKGVVSAAVEFKDAGVMLVKGFAKGIADTIGEVINVVGDLGGAAIKGLKDVLGIHSPAKETEPLGRHTGGGYIKGIKDSIPGAKAAVQTYGSEVINKMISDTKKNTPKVTAATEEMGKKVGQAGKKSFEEAVKWITDRKKLGKLNLSQELAEWQKLQKQYASGTKERIRADQEVYRVKKALGSATNKTAKEVYDKEVQRIDDLKYYNKMSTTQELAAWQALQKKYKANSEERKKIDREVYRVKQQMIQDNKDKESKAYDDYMTMIDDKKDYGMSTGEELAALKNLRRTTKMDQNQRKQVDKEIFNLEQRMLEEKAQDEQDAYNKYMDNLSDKKYYNQLSLGEELEALRHLKETYKLNADEIEETDKEIYRVKNELIAAQKEIDDEYYAHEKDINDKLKADSDALTEAYNQAIDSRTNTLYQSIGLFDKVEIKDPVSGTGLLNNLKGQVKAFEDWQKDIATLAAKGIDEGLLQELQDLGPASSAQVKALTTLSALDLKTYVEVWRQKYEDARTQATSELAKMKDDIPIEIKKLTAQAELDLDPYKQVWLDKTDQLVKGVKGKIDGFEHIIPASIVNFTPKVKTAFGNLITAIGSVFNKTNWSDIGKNILQGITNGINSNKLGPINGITSVAEAVLNAANNTLGIASPSKKFATVGMYINQGLVVGLEKYSRLVENAGANTGNTVLDSLQYAMTKVSDLLTTDTDMTPTIRPVIDMTDVQNGINSTFSQTQGLNVEGVTAKAVNISRVGSALGGGSTFNQTDNSVSSPIQIINNYTVRNDDDIRKIDNKLKNTLDRFSAARGVTVS